MRTFVFGILLLVSQIFSGAVVFADDPISIEVYGSPKLNEELSHCIHALDSAAMRVRQNPQLNVEFVDSIRGSILLSHPHVDPRGSNSEKKEFKSSDLDRCQRFGLSDQKLFLLKGVSGRSVVGEPERALHECGAGLFVLSWALEKRFGENRQVFDYGVRIGQDLGNTSQMFRLLFKNFNDSDEDILRGIGKPFSMYKTASVNANPANSTKAELLKKYFESCEAVGISSRSYVESLPIDLRPPVATDKPLCYCPPGLFCDYFECPLTTWIKGHNYPRYLQSGIIYAAILGVIASVTGLGYLVYRRVRVPKKG